MSTVTREAFERARKFRRAAKELRAQAQVLKGVYPAIANELDVHVLMLGEIAEGLDRRVGWIAETHRFTLSQLDGVCGHGTGDSCIACCTEEAFHGAP